MDAIDEGLAGWPSRATATPPLPVVVELIGLPEAEKLVAGWYESLPHCMWELTGVMVGEYASQATHAVVARDGGGEIVGLALYRDGDKPLLVGVFVLPHVRGRWVGARLAEAVLERLASERPVRVDVCDTRAFFMLSRLSHELRARLEVHDERRKI